MLLSWAEGEARGVEGEGGGEGQKHIGKGAQRWGGERRSTQLSPVAAMSLTPELLVQVLYKSCLCFNGPVYLSCTTWRQIVLGFALTEA